APLPLPFSPPRRPSDLTYSLGAPRRSKASQSGAIAFVVCHGILTERIAPPVQVPGDRFAPRASRDRRDDFVNLCGWHCFCRRKRSEEHTSELQSPYDLV